MKADPNFGAKMAALGRGGRPRIADKYGRVTDKTNRVFALAMPDEAERYLEHLQPQEPERCPVHQQLLRCPVEDCGTVSQRLPYDHKAAQYVFDRIMGKPTTRTETSVTVRLVQQLTEAFVVAFGVANEHADPAGRRALFAAACDEIGTRFDGGAT